MHQSHRSHSLEEAAAAALREVEQEGKEDDAPRLPQGFNVALRQLSRTMSSSIQRTRALMQLDVGTNEQVLRANQDAPAGFRATSGRRAEFLRSYSAHWTTAGQFYSAPPTVYSPSLHRYSLPGDEVMSRAAGSTRSEFGVYMTRPLSISADGTSAPSPRSQYTHEIGSLPSSHGAYSGFGSRSGGSQSGPHSRSAFSGPGSNSGGGSRSSGSGSRGTHKTSSWGSRQLQHNPRSLTSTSVLEEPAEGVILMPGVELDDHVTRFDQVLETVREGDGLLTDGASADADVAPVEVPQLSPAPIARRRQNMMTLDVTFGADHEEPSLEAPDDSASTARTQSWLSHHSPKEAEGEYAGFGEEPDKPPPSELHVTGAPGLLVELPPAPPVPDLLPDHVTSPVTRSVTLSRLSRLARSTTFSSPEPGAALAWDPEDPRAAPTTQVSSCSAPATVTLDPPPVQSDAGPSSLSAPSNMSSQGANSFGPSSSSDAATHPPSPPAASAAGAGEDHLANSNVPSSEELGNAPVVGGAPHRIMRLNPWAPLPGPNLAAVVAPVQHLAVGKRLGHDLNTADGLYTLRMADEIDAFKRAVTHVACTDVPIQEGEGADCAGRPGEGSATEPAASTAEQ